MRSVENRVVVQDSADMHFVHFRQVLAHGESLLHLLLALAEVATLPIGFEHPLGNKVNDLGNGGISRCKISRMNGRAYFL